MLALIEGEREADMELLGLKDEEYDELSDVEGDPEADGDCDMVSEAVLDIDADNVEVIDSEADSVTVIDTVEEMDEDAD